MYSAARFDYPWNAIVRAFGDSVYSASNLSIEISIKVEGPNITRRRSRLVVLSSDLLSSEVLAMSTSPVNTNQVSPKFLNVKELAELLRIKPRTVYEMVSQGRIPYRKAGDRTIFLLDEILEWTRPHTKR